MVLCSLFIMRKKMRGGWGGVTKQKLEHKLLEPKKFWSCRLRLREHGGRKRENINMRYERRWVLPSLLKCWWRGPLNIH